MSFRDTLHETEEYRTLNGGSRPPDQSEQPGQQPPRQQRAGVTIDDEMIELIKIVLLVLILIEVRR